MARIWTETCRYYEEMDPQAFETPAQDGLVDWFTELLRQTPTPNVFMVVAEIEGDIVGWVEAEVVSPAADADRQMMRDLGTSRLIVNNLVVDRSRWRTGAGRSLMNAAEAWGKDRGAAIAALDTYMHSPVSVPFYEKAIGALLVDPCSLPETLDDSGQDIDPFVARLAEAARVVQPAERRVVRCAHEIGHELDVAR